MFILRGTANVAPGGVVELSHGGNPTQPGGQQGKVVFQAHKRPEGDWAVKYMHPLSCFQAFNICISIFHNPTTAGLDALPAGDPRPMPLGASPANSTPAVSKSVGVGEGSRKDMEMAEN